VHLDDRVPLLGRHLRERAVAQDAGVVHQRVEPSELLDGRADDALAVLDLGAVADVEDGRPTGRRDLVDDGLAGRLVDLADDHGSPLPGELEGLTPAESSPGARDDRDLAVQESHGPTVLRSCGHVAAGLRVVVRGPPSRNRTYCP
jgi:hypothetical protein